MVAAAALAPPQQLARQALAQRLVEVVARERAVAQAVVDGLADAVQRLHRGDPVQRLPGVADHGLGRLLVGRLEPGGEDGEIRLGHGQRSPADARDQHQLVERLWSDVRPRGERQRRRPRRRVLQPHHGGGLRPARTEALGQVMTRQPERERLSARDGQDGSVHSREDRRPSRTHSEAESGLSSLSTSSMNSRCSSSRLRMNPTLSRRYLLR